MVNLSGRQNNASALYDSLHQFTQKMDLTIQNGYGVIESSHFNEAIYFPQWI